MMKKLVSVLLVTMLVLSCLAGVTFAADAEASWTDGKTTVEGTLAEMGKQASSKGGTIKLLKDVSLDSTSYAITSNQSFTFDLNGHNFTTAGMGISITNKATGVTVITDSVGGGLYRAAKNCATVRGGGLQIKNVTLWTEGTQTLNYYDVTGKWNNDNIIENATIVSDTWYCLSFNNDSSQEKASFTVKNSTLVSNHAKGHNLLGLQGKAVAANVVLGEGVKLYTKASAPINKSLNQFGETLTKSGSAKSVTVAGKTIDGLNEWTTPAKGTVDLTSVIPGGTAAPATPAKPSAAVSATPGTPAFPAAVSAASAKATWTLGGTTAEGTLSQLLAEAAKKGGTVKLLENAQFSPSGIYFVESNNSFTLDLNGNTIISEKGGISVGAKAKGITVIQNGTLLCKGQCNVSVRGGALQILNATLWSGVSQNINYFVKEATYNKANLIENSTIVSNKWYNLSFNNADVDQKDACFAVKNSVLVNTTKTSNLGLQAKPEGSTAQVALGENVKLYNAGSAAANKQINLLGEAVTKGATNVTVEAVGTTFDGLNEFTTPAKATLDLNAVIPGDAFTAPAETGTATAPATPATPSAPSASESGVTFPSTVPAATAKATWTLGGTTVEGTLKQLVAEAAKKGGTVTLLENAEFTGSNQYPINADASFTLDLGGNTIVTEKSLLSVTNKAKGITVIKNGTVLSKGACVVTVRGGALQIVDATLWSGAAQTINYYVVGDTYNQANLIQNSTVVSEKWYALSFNNTDANQKDTCFGIENSTLVNTQKTAALGLQLKPEGSTAQVAFGENVKLYTAGADATHKQINRLGAELTKNASGVSVSVAGATFTGLNEFVTAADDVDLSTVIPGAPFTAPAETGTATAPAAPSATGSVELDYEHSGDALKKDAPAATLTELGSSSGSVGLIIAIVAAVAVVAVVAIVVVKKKKK